MSDACGCSDDETTPAGQEAEEHEADRLWQVRELQAAAVAGVLLVGALFAGGADRPGLQLGLEVAALAVGAWTFVPSTLRRLAKGKIGVGTLMTIAARTAVGSGASRPYSSQRSSDTCALSPNAASSGVLP